MSKTIVSRIKKAHPFPWEKMGLIPTDKSPCHPVERGQEPSFSNAG